jgi:hypothetical protein
MLASGNNHKYVAAAPIQNSLGEVVKLAQTQLHDLLTRREEIGRRIRNLRQAVGGLESVPSEPALDRAIIRGLAVGSRSHTRGRSNQACLNLKRACRIALMEVGETASPEEIHSRIVRRGSFTFGDADFALPAIVRALHAMAYAREVRRLEDSQGCRWYLVV